MRTNGDLAPPEPSAYAAISAILAALEPAGPRLERLRRLAASHGLDVVIHDGRASGSATVAGGPDEQLASAVRSAANVLLRERFYETQRATAAARRESTSLELERRIAARRGWPSSSASAASLALWHLPIGLVTTNQTGAITYVNAHAARLLGVDAGALLAKSWRTPELPVSREVLDRVAAHVRARGRYAGVARVADARGLRQRYLAVDATVLDADLVRILLWDASESTLETEWLHWAATRDALTGLRNRAGLTELLHHWGDRALPGVVWIDVVGVGTLNRALGPHVGDELLRIVADRIVAELGPSDVAARVGGDEFAVLIHDRRATRRLSRSLSLTLNDDDVLVDGNSVHLAVRLAASARSHAIASGADHASAIWAELAHLERTARQTPAPSRRLPPRRSARHERPNAPLSPQVRWIGFIEVTSGERVGSEVVLVDELGHQLRDHFRQLHAADRYNHALLERIAASPRGGRFIALRPLDPTSSVVQALEPNVCGAQLQVTFELDDIPTATAKVAAAPIAREARLHGLRGGLDLGSRFGGELEAIAHLEPDQLLIALRPARSRSAVDLRGEQRRMLEALAAFARELGCELVATHAFPRDHDLLRGVALATGARLLAAPTLR